MAWINSFWVITKMLSESAKEEKKEQVSFD